jgi:hypothetical protein
MRRIAFAWQLGGGYGHLAQMLPLVQDLSATGNRIFGFLRDLAGGAQILSPLKMKLFQAPAKTRGKLFFSRGINFAHLLGNLGFCDKYELFGLASAWRNLFHLVRPDLIVFDHSPMALLGARGLPMRRMLIGSGFCCPPDTYPLPFIRSHRVEEDIKQATTDEERILERVNRLLSSWMQPPLERLGQLYGEVDETFLTTFPELDH